MDWITPSFLVGVVLLVILILTKEHQRRRIIRRSGTKVVAKVTQVRTWTEGQIKDYSTEAGPIGGKLRYEVIAEYLDPSTMELCMVSSGIKNGLPNYQQGDSVTAYISLKGNYLEL